MSAMAEGFGLILIPIQEWHDKEFSGQQLLAKWEASIST